MRMGMSSQSSRSQPPSLQAEPENQKARRGIVQAMATGSIVQGNINGIGNEWSVRGSPRRITGSPRPEGP
jgi:hypothetical protein